jgi:hypothetical protein
MKNAHKGVFMNRKIFTISVLFFMLFATGAVFGDDVAVGGDGCTEVSSNTSRIQARIVDNSTQGEVVIAVTSFLHFPLRVSYVKVGSDEYWADEIRDNEKSDNTIRNFGETIYFTLKSKTSNNFGIRGTPSVEVRLRACN